MSIALPEGQELVIIAHKYKALSQLLACYGWITGIRVIDGRRVVSQNRYR
jgi:hypothetical protein